MLPPGPCLQPKRPLGGQLRVWAREGLFLELYPLAGGPERRGVSADLPVAQRSGENLGPGFCLGVQAGL